MSTWQEIRCPACRKLLFEVTEMVTGQIRIHCRCKRVLQISEGLFVEVIQEQQPTIR